MKKTTYKKDRLLKSRESDRENSLDYYMTKNLSNNIWWDTNDEASKDRSEDLIKAQFLKKDLKITRVIPSKMTKAEETPDTLGCFDSRFGTISVGYEKYKKNTDLTFSLIPEKVKKAKRISSSDLDNPDTYFAKATDKRDTFRSSQLSFVYNSETGVVEKLGLDDETTDEWDLLYDDEDDEDRIEELTKSMSWGSPSRRQSISKEISDAREIRREEKKDNADLVKEIREFIRKVKKDKLKKIIESDVTISRSKRMSDSSMELIIFRRMIKKLLKELFGDSYLSKINDFDIDKADKSQLKKIIRELKNKLG